MIGIDKEIPMVVREMKVTIVIPCYNEEGYITKCLRSLIQGDYPLNDMEILVYDGGSTDNTWDNLKTIAQDYPCIHIKKNPSRIKVKAVNQGFREGIGELFVLCDAHCEYSKNYVSELVKYHTHTPSGNIGGVCDTYPGDNTTKAFAIALAISSPIGVGISFRNIKDGTARYVDTVPFGSWRRDVIERIGGFNEDFIRGHDREHNVRLRQSGEKILMLPWLHTKYYARRSFATLSKTIYHIGYWTNRVNKEHRSLNSMRQLAPPLMLMVLVSLGLVTLLHPAAWFLFFGSILAYLGSITTASIYLSRKAGNLKMLFYLILSLCIIHFSHGIGYVKGFVDFFILNRQGSENPLGSVTR